MVPRWPLLACLVALVPAAFPGTLLAALAHQHIEDFTTTTFKSPYTTAWWDTTAGELKLFPLPELIGACDTPGSARRVVVAGNRAFVADEGVGLQVFDIGDPGSPFIVGSCDTWAEPYDVVVRGDHAFVADGNDGLTVIDVTDPALPALIATQETGGLARGVFISGMEAYLADGDQGLEVIQIADLITPELLESAGCGDVTSLKIVGDRAYTIASEYYLLVFDISDPTAPSVLGSYYTAPKNIKDVFVSGDYAYVTCPNYTDYGDLHVIDVSDPAHPDSVGHFSSPQLQARHVFVS